MNVCVTTRMRLREWRSAYEPPKGPAIIAGMKFMNAAKPSQVVECVMWYTTNGTAIVCIQLPVLETNAALQKIEKSRRLRTLNDVPCGRSASSLTTVEALEHAGDVAGARRAAGSTARRPSPAPSASRTDSGLSGRPWKPSFTAIATRPM